jgi:23S rRNA (uracil1939-C5)-methyltransferase
MLEFEARIEKLASSGAGIARMGPEQGPHGGKVAFIHGALPGELVMASIVASRASYIEAHVTRIIEASPARRPAPCPYYGSCGGCELQHASDSAQSELVAGIVAESLQRIGRVGPAAPLRVRVGSAWGYRNRMRFHRGPGDRPGLKAARSASVVALESCAVARPEIGEALLDKGLRRAMLPPRGAERTVFACGGRLYIEGRDPMARAEILGKEFAFPTGAFFQSNLECAALLLESLLEGMGGERALDLYAGSGLFTAFLAERFGAVDAVELDAEAARACAANAPRAKVIAARAEEWAARADLSAYDLALLDPPRVGLAPALRARLAESGPRRIAYVSCEHQSLARDLGDLSKRYELKSVEVFHFYPQTARAECLALLEAR